MKRIIIFSQKELEDMLKGAVIDHRLHNGEKVCFMCETCYESLISGKRKEKEEE